MAFLPSIYYNWPFFHLFIRRGLSPIRWIPGRCTRGRSRRGARSGLPPSGSTSARFSAVTGSTVLYVTSSTVVYAPDCLIYIHDCLTYSHSTVLHGWAGGPSDATRGDEAGGGREVGGHQVAPRATVPAPARPEKAWTHALLTRCSFRGNCVSRRNTSSEKETSSERKTQRHFLGEGRHGHP